ncbi:MAG: type II toxin-antitoxin system HicB family antitoxin [Clostridiales bacterium]|nr:type II toxin-antitoxin system HicB family antitoxin [Clostridiales bacterium]
MAKYVYPAVFTKEDNGYSVRFPDIDGCYTQGETVDEAMKMAQDVLTLMLYDCEEDNREIKSPSNIRDLQLADNEFSSLICADTLEYRRYFDNKSVKKNCTIPTWLNTLSERENINFSAVLQEALIKKLDI